MKNNKKETLWFNKEIKIKVFTHNDLDGVSCSIILKKLYDSNRVNFSFEFIGYNEFEKIKEFFKPENEQGARFFDLVLFTDLNFKKIDFMEYIRDPYIDLMAEINSPHSKYKNTLLKKLFFIDHHIDSEKTFRDDSLLIFKDIEYYNDLSHCATWQLADWCIHKKSTVWNDYLDGCMKEGFNIAWIMDYIKYVDDWDLFHWKENKNLMARDLNLLFSHIKRDKFTVMQIQKDSPVFSFNKTEKTIINETLESIHREYQRALTSSIVMDHVNQNGIYNHDLQYLVIRSDENISLICDMIKEEIKEKHIYPMFNIGYIVNVSFKYGALNFRRIDENIDLCKIANWYGGGGHPFASGCPLNSKDQNLMKNFIYPILSKY